MSFFVFGYTSNGLSARISSACGGARFTEVRRPARWRLLVAPHRGTLASGCSPIRYDNRTLLRPITDFARCLAPLPLTTTCAVCCLFAVGYGLACIATVHHGLSPRRSSPRTLGTCTGICLAMVGASRSRYAGWFFACSSAITTSCSQRAVMGFISVSSSRESAERSPRAAGRFEAADARPPLAETVSFSIAVVYSHAAPRGGFADARNARWRGDVAGLPTTLSAARPRPASVVERERPRCAHLRGHSVDRVEVTRAIVRTDRREDTIRHRSRDGRLKPRRCRPRPPPHGSLEASLPDRICSLEASRPEDVLRGKLLNTFLRVRS